MKGNKKEEAFKDMFGKNYSDMYYCALFFVNDAETAKDIVHDIFAKLWEEFSPDEHSYTAAFLRQCVRNRCLDHLKHENIKNRYAQLYSNFHQIGGVEDDCHDEYVELIRQVMSRMSPRTRFIMDQCFYEHKKYAEVAAILGISTSGVKQHIVKALKMLRDAFKSKDKCF